MEEKLSSTLVNYSLSVKENEKVLITYYDESCKNLVKNLIKEITKVNAYPFVKIIDEELDNLLLKEATESKTDIMAKLLKEEVENYDSFITIRYNKNEYENSNISPIIRKSLGKKTIETKEIRTNERKWVLLNYPSHLDAYKAKMSYDDFYNYAFNAMNYDYSKTKELIKPLKELMLKTDKVRIISPKTDISFSIKDMNVIECLGNFNIPDGEIFTAPVKTSVNGVITYNVDSPYNGNIYKNVSLTFKDGKIINAICDGDIQKLNEIFETDEGSKYVGEFALGINPNIKYPISDILFDEKIIGSIHFTPGAAYKEAYNQNDSSIHWDMVLIQREDFGGGEIYFDEVLVRKDGLFVLDELLPLNYSEL